MLRSHALNWHFMKGTGWMKGVCLIKGPTFLSLPAGSVGDQRVGDQLASETYVKEKSHKARCHTLHQHDIMHAHSHIPRAKFSPLFKRSAGLNLGLTRHSASLWCFIQYWILFSSPCCGYFVYACACFQKLKCLP